VNGRWTADPAQLPFGGCEGHVVHEAVPSSIHMYPTVESSGFKNFEIKLHCDGEAKTIEATPQKSKEANDVNLIEPTIDISRRCSLQLEAREEQGCVIPCLTLNGRD